MVSQAGAVDRLEVRSLALVWLAALAVGLSVLHLSGRQLAGQLGQQGALLAFTAVVAARFGYDMRAQAGPPLRMFTEMATGGLTGLGVQGMLWLSYWPVADIVGEYETEFGPAAVDGSHFGQLAMAVAVGVVLAPVAEELFFRMAIQENLLSTLTAPARVLWSSVLFTVSHNWGYHLIGILIGGVIAGSLAARGRGLAFLISLHMASNAVAISI